MALSALVINITSPTAPVLINLTLSPTLRTVAVVARLLQETLRAFHVSTSLLRR